MIDEIIAGRIYSSPTGVPFIVIFNAAHGQDCSLPMVVYQNVEATKDYPPGKIWTIEESLFLKQFSEFEEGFYHEYNNARTSDKPGLRPSTIPDVLAY